MYKKSYKTEKVGWLGFILAVVLLLAVCGGLGLALAVNWFSF